MQIRKYHRKNVKKNAKIPAYLKSYIFPAIWSVKIARFEGKKAIKATLNATVKFSTCSFSSNCMLQCRKETAWRRDKESECGESEEEKDGE